MDCEKFESTLLDLLYDELDEVTSAAAKRHVSGCARCAALLSGLEATKRAAVLPIVEPPADLEDRILRAAREAQKVVPIRGRLSRAVSQAGSWAMRPQTAMAALFLLMIGSSTLLLKGRKAPSSAVTVSDEGEPVASVVATPPVARPVDLEKQIAEAKGGAAAAAPPAASAIATATTAPNAYAQEESPTSLDGLSRGGGGAPAGRAAAPKSYAQPPPPPSDLSGLVASDDGKAQNAGAVAGAPAPMKPSAYGGDVASHAKKDDSSNGVQAANAPVGGSTSGPGAASQQQAPSAFDAAKSAFDAANFASALAQFDALYAQTSDPVSELYAARSAMNANGCTSDAINRFETVIAAAPATRVGYDARYYEAQCYVSVNDVSDARVRLGQLLTVPSYAARAQALLATINGKGSATSKARSAPAPSPSPQQAPPNATGQSY